MIVVGYYGFMLGVRVSIQLSIPLSVIYQSVFSFPYDNLVKIQWIFTEFGMCFDVVEICFGIVNGQILSSFDRFFLFPDDKENISGFSPNLVCAFIL